MNNEKSRKLERVLAGEKLEVPPVWLMRQAGRYLPEYRETRKRAGSFLDLCYTPELAIEVTLQPIERFGFDASILFSDILVIPDALGREVNFVEGRGPVLNALRVDDINQLNVSGVFDHLDPVFRVVSGLRDTLPSSVSLIGFCGAPWTVATYMIAGSSTSDQAPARLFALKEEVAMMRLMEILVEASSNYLIEQVKHGADVLQIFYSWAGVFSDDQFEKWCVGPVREIVSRVRSVYPEQKIIGFPKGAGSRYVGYGERTGVDCVGLDWTVSAEQAKRIQHDSVIQGNLDPMRLVAGGKALETGVETILQAFNDGPHIFNLGHGITPETPISHVEYMLELIRNR